MSIVECNGFRSASDHFHEAAQRNDHRMYIAKECNRYHKHNTEVKENGEGEGGGIMSSLAELTYSAPLVDICSPDPHWFWPSGGTMQFNTSAVQKKMKKCSSGWYTNLLRCIRPGCLLLLYADPHKVAHWSVADTNSEHTEHNYRYELRTHGRQLSIAVWFIIDRKRQWVQWLLEELFLGIWAASLSVINKLEFCNHCNVTLPWNEYRACQRWKLITFVGALDFRLDENLIRILFLFKM